MTAGKRLRVLVLLLALAAALAFAATASAETRAGGSTTVTTEFTPTPEATIVKAIASYETSGNVTFDLTTAGAATPASEGEIYAALTTSSNCVPATGRDRFFEELFFEATPPIVAIKSTLGTAGAVGVTGSLFAAKPIAATKGVSGTATTLTGGSSEIANGSFNCAIIAASDGEELRVPEGEGRGTSFFAVPLVTQAEPPPAPSSGPSPSGAPAASPPPATAAPVRPALSIARVKPLTLPPGKWRSVSVKVINSGTGGSAVGSLRLKAPKGVLAKPERQQLPPLAAGRSFTVSFRVRLTAKAKKKSTVSLTASAPGAG